MFDSKRNLLDALVAEDLSIMAEFTSRKARRKEAHAKTHASQLEAFRSATYHVLPRELYDAVEAEARRHAPGSFSDTDDSPDLDPQAPA